MGTSVYENLRKRYGKGVIGIDSDEENVQYYLKKGRIVAQGDAVDYDFWQRGTTSPQQINIVFLTMSHAANIIAAQSITDLSNFPTLAATVRYNDEIEPLKKAGVDLVFDVFDEAGTGFSNHVCEVVEKKSQYAK